MLKIESKTAYSSIIKCEVVSLSAMKVTITFEDNFFPLEVSEDLELENLKALLEFETGVPSVDIGVFYNGVSLKELKKPLKEFGVKDGEILVMIKRQLNPKQAQRGNSGKNIMKCRFLYLLEI